MLIKEWVKLIFSKSKWLSLYYSEFNGPTCHKHTANKEKTESYYKSKPLNSIYLAIILSYNKLPALI